MWMSVIAMPATQVSGALRCWKESIRRGAASLTAVAKVTTADRCPLFSRSAHAPQLFVVESASVPPAMGATTHAKGREAAPGRVLL